MKPNIERGLKRFSWLFGIITGGLGFIIQGEILFYRFKPNLIIGYVISTLIGMAIGFLVFRLIIWIIKGFSKDELINSD